MLDFNEIKKNYERFDDTKILRIAEKESKGLRDEVIPILLEEIEKRKLGVGLIHWIKAERRKLSTSELRALRAKVRNCLCENCKKNRKLKGYKFDTMIGLLIMRVVTNYQLIVCEECGKKKRTESTILTVFLGWLSVRGFISYPFFVADKIKSYYKEEQQSEQLIDEFINDHIGKITLGKDEQEVIQKLLKDYH